MSAITAELVAKLARVWHRAEVSDKEAEAIARVLGPMDDAAESAAEALDLEAEPSDFEIALDELGPGP